VIWYQNFITETCSQPQFYNMPVLSPSRGFGLPKTGAPVAAGMVIGVDRNLAFRYAFVRENFGEEVKMAKLVVLYKTPADKDAFDKYYAETHIPIAKKIPGLKSYEVSKGVVASAAGEAGVHLVALLEFDSLAAIQSAFASPEGQAAGGDLANFATGGADMLMFDTVEV
jgi:uncharacterized protein (TIGR02118 family)